MFKKNYLICAFVGCHEICIDRPLANTYCYLSLPDYVKLKLFVTKFTSITLSSTGTVFAPNQQHILHNLFQLYARFITKLVLTNPFMHHAKVWWVKRSNNICFMINLACSWSKLCKIGCWLGIKIVPVDESVMDVNFVTKNFSFFNPDM